MLFKNKNRKEVIIILIKNFNYFRNFGVNNINYYALNKGGDIETTNNYIRDGNIKRGITENLGGYNEVAGNRNIVGARIYFAFLTINIFLINIANFN